MASGNISDNLPARIMRQVWVNKDNPVSINIGTWASALIIGMLNGFGPIALVVFKSTNIISQVSNLYDFSAWNNSSLTFSASGDDLIISSTTNTPNKLLVIYN